jgi:hypothetical protein
MATTMLGQGSLAVYENSLGGALRAAGYRGGTGSLDAVSLEYRLNAVSDVLDGIRGSVILQQELILAVAQRVNMQLRLVIVPTLSVQPDVEATKRAVTAALEQLRAELQGSLGRTVAGHLRNKAEWQSSRRSRGMEVGVIAITLTFSCAAVALSAPTGVVAAAAAYLGIVRGTIDALVKVRDCWLTVEQQGEHCRRNVRLLQASYDRSSTIGRMHQIGSTIADKTSLSKATVLTGGLVEKMHLTKSNHGELKGSVKQLEDGVALYRSKLAHLYVHTDRLAGQLVVLLDRIDGGGQSDRQAVELRNRVSALIEGGNHRQGVFQGRTAGWRHGFFHDRFTVGHGYSRYRAGCTTAQVLLAGVEGLKRADGHAQAVAIVNALVGFVCNGAIKLMNYDGLLHVGQAPSRAELIEAAQWTAEASGQAAAVMGWMNDAIGVCQESLDVAGAAQGGAFGQSVGPVAQPLVVIGDMNRVVSRAPQLAPMAFEPFDVPLK